MMKIKNFFTTEHTEDTEHTGSTENVKSVFCFLRIPRVLRGDKPLIKSPFYDNA